MESKVYDQFRLGNKDLDSLFQKISSEDYRSIGPVARDGAIMLEELKSFDEIAMGYEEEQGKGHYKLSNTQTSALFQYTLGPQSFKNYLHPPRRKLWSADGSKQAFEISQPHDPPKFAFWGVRSCDLAAIKILDKVFMGGVIENDWYKLARDQLFIVAVGCTRPSNNCFCTSMGDGPMPQQDFDISLIEVLEDDEHFFIAQAGSSKGQKLLEECRCSHGGKEEISKAIAAIQKAIDEMPVRFDPLQASQLLRNNLEHKHWEEVAQKCLSCANCTMVCPTCFCTTTEDITDITGDHTERWLRWDSCFNGEFSYIHGGQIRNTTKSRYRQWMTHKLSNWYDQFGSSGCVGCGRCITWCPVGIDITEELLALKDQVPVEN